MPTCLFLGVLFFFSPFFINFFSDYLNQNKTFLSVSKSEVESRTQCSRPRPRTQKTSEAKAKDTKNIRGQGQGQECSRPRTKDTGASVLQKTKVFKNFFWAISNLLAYREFLSGGGLNYKSHEMTSSKFFHSFCETKISLDGRSEIVVACFHVTKILHRTRA